MNQTQENHTVDFANANRKGLCSINPDTALACGQVAMGGDAEALFEEFNLDDIEVIESKVFA